MASSSAGRIAFRAVQRAPTEAHRNKSCAQIFIPHCAMRGGRAFWQTYFPMPRSIFIAILCALALPSCSPDRRDADEDARRDESRHAKRRDSFPDYKENHEQLSATNSVGRVPLPRNLIAGVPDICPVHHQKMTVREVPIVFEDTEESGTEAAKGSASPSFPFAAEKVVSEGNALAPTEALTARVYQCEACIAAQKAAKRMRGTAALPSAGN